MWGGGQSDEPVRFDDINMGNWHSTSHNDPKGGGGQQMIKVQAFMAKQLLYFMGKLQSYADGQFSLLDNTAAVLSTQNGCSTQVAFAPMDHPKQNCPLIIGGRRRRGLEAGQGRRRQRPQPQRRLPEHRQGVRHERHHGRQRRLVQGAADHYLNPRRFQTSAMNSGGKPPAFLRE